jgi:hypothetical protein
MKTITSILTLSCVFLIGCGSTGPNTQRGAAGGAATGAVLGGIIGHQSGSTGRGAVLGAAAGGIAGAAMGGQQDRVAHSTGAYETRDSYGYSEADYLGLITPAEVDTLRARAQGRSGNLADFLTDQERANLRARHQSRSG